MADLILVEQLKAYLIAQGVAQHFSPTVAPSLTVPSITISPLDGAPQPRDGENATVTLIDTNLGSPSNLEPWMEESFIDVIVRHRNGGAAKLLQRSIKGLLFPIDAHGGRKMWMMNDLLIEQSDVWRGDQPLPYSVDKSGTSRLQTFDRVQSFRFLCRRKSLAGQPYAP